MIIYNNNSWGPALDKDGNPVLERVEKCEKGCCELNNPCYKAIMDSMFRRQSEARRYGDDNADIVHKIVKKEQK